MNLEITNTNIMNLTITCLSLFLDITNLKIKNNKILYLTNWNLDITKRSFGILEETNLKI